MIREAKEKRRGRHCLVESVERRDSVDRLSKVTHTALSDVGKRSAKRGAIRVDRPSDGPRHCSQDQLGLAICHTRDEQLSEQENNTIYKQYRCGTPVETLAGRYRRTKASVQRIITEMRVGRIMKFPLDFIPNPQFSNADAESVIMTAMPSDGAPLKTTRSTSGLPPYLASLFEVPLLTREQEVHLFRKFNYLKYKASKLRSQLDPASANLSLMDQIEQFYEKAVAVKNQIVRANLRLVVSIAKRYVGPNGDLWELVSEGNMSLMRAIEKFDFARGNKVSTYASWAIMKNFARSIPSEQRHRDRFRTGHAETFSSSKEHRSDEYEQETVQRQRESQVRKILARLDDREQKVVMSRFGLVPGHAPQTLEDIGTEMGVSKERIRQIQTRALNKLRLAAEAERIELPDIG
jgi:RNA polymerase primary sigma factor